jgi:hypothetical protein
MNFIQNIKTFFTILYIFFTNFTYIIHPQLSEYDKIMEPIKLCYIIDNIKIIDENEDYQNIENAVEDNDEEIEKDEEDDQEDDQEDEEVDEKEEDEEVDEEENEEDEKNNEEDKKEDVKEEIDNKVELPILENNNKDIDVNINKDSQLLEENKDIKDIIENSQKVEEPIKKRRKYVKKNHNEFKEFNKNIIQEFKNSN